MTSFIRGSCVLLTLVALGCAHARPATSRFINGRPPEYELPEATAGVSVGDFIQRIRELQSEALAARPQRVIPTIEANDSALKQSLSTLADRPTAENHRRVATEYLRVHVTDFAADHFSAAIALDPRDAASYEMRARIWRDWGFPQNGLADAYRAVYHAPGSPTSHNTLGMVFHRLHRYADARTEYERALRLDPTASYARINLCSLDLLENRPAQATDSCGRAVALDSLSVLARQNLELARNLVTAAAEAQNAPH